MTPTKTELPAWPEPFDPKKQNLAQYLGNTVELEYLRARADAWEARARLAVEKLEGIAERPSGYHDCGDYERGYGDGRNAAGGMARVTLAEIGPLPERAP